MTFLGIRDRKGLRMYKVIDSADDVIALMISEKAPNSMPS